MAPGTIGTPGGRFGGALLTLGKLVFVARDEVVLDVVAVGCVLGVDKPRAEDTVTPPLARELDVVIVVVAN